MQDEEGFEVCEIHPESRLVQPQGELQDVCLICKRIEWDDKVLNDE